MTDTPTSYTIRDGNGTTRTLIADVDPGGNLVPQHILRANGAEVGVGNAFPVADAAAETALAAIVGTQGAGATGVTQPAGGSGVLGWLSGIYSRLSGTLAVSGTFWQATQPVSVATLPALSAGSAAIGTVGVTALPAIPAGSNTIGAVLQSGSTGTDYSANAAAIPIATYVLLATIPATPARAYVEVQNQSAGTIQVVRDDGAGNNQTTILIAPGSGAGAQGGGWSSATFKGRIRVYGATGAQVAAYQE